MIKGLKTINTKLIPIPVLQDVKVEYLIGLRPAVRKQILISSGRLII